MFYWTSGPLVSRRTQPHWMVYWGYVILRKFLFVGKNFAIFTKMTNKMQLCRIIYCSLTTVHVSSDIFAHHQEHLNCMYSFWFYSRVSLSVASRQRHTWIKPEAVITVKMLLMMSGNIDRNMYSSQGKTDYPTQLHLVGHFCKNRVMMHGSMNVKKLCFCTKRSFLCVYIYIYVYIYMYIR